MLLNILFWSFFFFKLLQASHSVNNYYYDMQMSIENIFMVCLRVSDTEKFLIHFWEEEDNTKHIRFTLPVISTKQASALFCKCLSYFRASSFHHLGFSCLLWKKKYYKIWIGGNKWFTYTVLIASCLNAYPDRIDYNWFF